jgi:hypothetical protein
MRLAVTSKPLLTVIRNASLEVVPLFNQLDLFTRLGQTTFVKEDRNAAGISEMLLGTSVFVRELVSGLAPMVTGK